MYIFGRSVSPLDVTHQQSLVWAAAVPSHPSSGTCRCLRGWCTLCRWMWRATVNMSVGLNSPPEPPGWQDQYNVSVLISVKKLFCKSQVSYLTNTNYHQHSEIIFIRPHPLMTHVLTAMYLVHWEEGCDAYLAMHYRMFAVENCFPRCRHDAFLYVHL